MYNGEHEVFVQNQDTWSPVSSYLLFDGHFQARIPSVCLIFVNAVDNCVKFTTRDAVAAGVECLLEPCVSFGS
jgi:hypothetical protein